MALLHCFGPYGLSDFFPMLSNSECWRIIPGDLISNGKCLPSPPKTWTTLDPGTIAWYMHFVYGTIGIIILLRSIGFRGLLFSEVLHWWYTRWYCLFLEIIFLEILIDSGQKKNSKLFLKNRFKYQIQKSFFLSENKSLKTNRNHRKQFDCCVSLVGTHLPLFIIVMGSSVKGQNSTTIETWNVKCNIGSIVSIEWEDLCYKVSANDTSCT